MRCSKLASFKMHARAGTTAYTGDIKIFVSKRIEPKALKLLYFKVHLQVSPFKFAIILSYLVLSVLIGVRQLE